MSAEASNWAWRVPVAPVGAKLLLMKLADIADNEGHIRFISAEYLSRHTGISRSTLYEHMRRLEDAGVFGREKSQRRADGGDIVTGRLILNASIAATAAEAGTADRGESEIRTGGSPKSGQGGVRIPDRGESGFRTRTI